MPVFTNMATLTYSGGTVNSNVVTGEIRETLAVTKTAVTDSYGPGDDLTYVISIVNSGTAPFNGLTLTDDLGAYDTAAGTVVPLTYQTGSVLYYVNGALQPAPTVTAENPLTVTGITVPAGGNALIVYEARANGFAPLNPEGSVTNTVSVTGGGLLEPVTATETVTVRQEADLVITKALEPALVSDNGQLTYTFTVQNFGNTPVVATDDAVMNDTFDPILNPITVTFNGTPWTEGVNYTYDAATGAFATVAGQITVPAGTAVQNPDGTWTVTPGTAVITVTGTV